MEMFIKLKKRETEDQKNAMNFRKGFIGSLVFGDTDRLLNPALMELMFGPLVDLSPEKSDISFNFPAITSKNLIRMLDYLKETSDSNPIF